MPEIQGGPATPGAEVLRVMEKLKTLASEVEMHEARVAYRRAYELVNNMVTVDMIRVDQIPKKCPDCPTLTPGGQRCDSCQHLRDFDDSFFSGRAW